MKSFPVWLLVFAAIGCTNPSSAPTTQETSPTTIENSDSTRFTDNPELITLYENDQADRMVDDINWAVVNKRDSARRVRVTEILAANEAKTANDFHHAAMVFQHGHDSTDYGKAVRLMEKAMAMDTTLDKWLYAATLDRYLLSKDEPQIFGTQIQKFGDGPWILGEIDTTKITDEERKEYGVEPLAERRAIVRKMNLEDGLE